MPDEERHRARRCALRVVRDDDGLWWIAVDGVRHRLGRLAKLAEQAVRRHAVVHRDGACRHVVSVFARRACCEQMILRLPFDAPCRLCIRLDAVPARIWQLLPCQPQAAVFRFGKRSRERLSLAAERICLLADEDDRDDAGENQSEEGEKFQNGCFQRY